MKDTTLDFNVETISSERDVTRSGAPRFSTRLWLVLLLCCLGQFMVVLDFSIVNVALPSIQQDLGFSTQNLQWIVSAYALIFGSFLLLGGRVGDIFGKRRFFLLGLAIFVVASLVGGLTKSQGILIAVRAFQGLGAAFVSPTSFSLLTTSFAEGPDRNKALGVFAAFVSSGLVFGNILGGLLTASGGWQWVFFINIPVAVLAFVGAWILMRDHERPAQRPKIDILGSLVATIGLVALVYVMAKGNEMGWLSLPTLGLILLAIVSLVAFVFLEKKIKEPLVRLGIFKLRSLTVGNLLSLLAPGVFTVMIFFLTLYMHDILHYEPLVIGVAFLPLAAIVGFGSSYSSRLAPRLGTKRMLLVCLLLMVAGFLLLLTTSTQNNYLTTVLPGMILVCLGMGPTFMLLAMLTTNGVEEHEQGLASGLLNTAQQVGGVILLAIVTTIATAVTTSLGGSPDALMAGYHASYIAGAIAAFIAFLIVVFLHKTQD